jgi:hypothetical protein
VKAYLDKFDQGNVHVKVEHSDSSVRSMEELLNMTTFSMLPHWYCDSYLLHLP